MCGIVGAVCRSGCFQAVLGGLVQLQNRGYDSAGICTLNKRGEPIVHKYASALEETAIEKLAEDCKEHNEAVLGIGHTRWATHGPKTDENSHPHWSSDEEFYLVHNGIIENYAKLRVMLLEKGYTFSSSTDTEIIVNLLAYVYNEQDTKSVVDAIITTTGKLKGTYALGIVHKGEADKIYCIRRGSPLLVSANDEFAMIVSEKAGFCNKVSSYIDLENDDLCIIQYNGTTYSYESSSTYKAIKMSAAKEPLTPNPFPYWTEKEIHEQHASYVRAINRGGRLDGDIGVKLGGLASHHSELIGVDNLIILGCGTSYHAGLIGASYFRELAGFSTVSVLDGSDFTKDHIPKLGSTALLLLSQSGETRDLHRCLEVAKDNELLTIGVINVVDSQIARQVHCGVYLNAGREVAVASTKCFTSQCIVLALIAIWFSQNRNIHKLKRTQYVRDLRQLDRDIREVLMLNEKVEEMLPLFEKHNSCFLLGKGRSEAISREGSLKIKEIAYLHSEAYSGSALKHGPFGLLEKDFPVILVDPNNSFHRKMASAYEEIESRYAVTLTITDDPELAKERSYVITIPRNETFSDLLAVYPLQLLAYRLALKRGNNPDFPRNLCKVVTVF